MDMLLLANFDVDGKGAALIVTSLISAVAVARLYLRGTTAVENHKRVAIDVMGLMRDWGFKRIPDFIGDLVVSDLTTVLRKLHNLKEFFTDPDLVGKEMNNVFETVLRKQIENPEGRAALRARLKKLFGEVGERLSGE